MPYVYMGFGVFFLVTSLQNVIEAPSWAWSLCTLLLGFTILGLCSGIEKWYVAFPVSGIATLILRVENLLLIKADETINNLRRRH